MSAVWKSAAGLRVSGDALDPSEITSLLGSAPTYSQRHGDKKRLSTGKEVVRKGGTWILDADDRTPEDLDGQVAEILSRLTTDIAAWRSLSRQYQVDLFCGLFMHAGGEGFSLSLTTLEALATRGVEIQVCIYAPGGEVRVDDPCPCSSGKAYGECCAPQTEPNKALQPTRAAEPNSQREPARVGPRG